MYFSIDKSISLNFVRCSLPLTQLIQTTTMSLLYKLRSGKNSKLLYYLRNYMRLLVPAPLCRMQGKRLCHSVKRLSPNEQSYIEQRVSYYCRMESNTKLSPDAITVGSHWKVNRKTQGSVYFFDSYRYTRLFPKQLRCSFLFGDINYTPTYPALTKSRPISEDNQNGVIMKFNQIRHYIFVNDATPFESKLNKVVFRGKVWGKDSRMHFMQQFLDNPLCDVGDVTHNPNIPSEWKRAKMAIADHLQYKFVMAIEGNDVASNLKWVMSSNSVAVMPRPTCESWFMEKQLIPDYHYIEVAPDFSNLLERIQYYIEHPDEAKVIAQHANEYVTQFRNNKREHLISALTLQRYFEQSGQL